METAGALTNDGLPPQGTAGLSWRPLTLDDLPGWARLVAEAAAVDRPAMNFSADDLRDVLVKGSWKDPAHNSLVGLDTEGTPQAFGVVDSRPGEVRSIRVFCDGVVHPTWRRRGAGSAVLSWQRARALEIVAAKQRALPPGRELPVRVVVNTDEHLVDRLPLLERHGFAPVRWYTDMVRPLTGQGAEPVREVRLGDGLRLVPFDQPLAEPVRLAHNEAFAEHWGTEPRTAEDWQELTVGSRETRLDWSFVVLDGDEVAGYTVAAAYHADWEVQGYTQGWTDLLGVRAAWRRRGIASALLAASMAAFTRDGMEYAGLGVDTGNESGALEVYERMGYRPDRRLVAYDLRL